MLQNFEIGCGKIIVSNTYQGSFSYYWGSMGSDIETFLNSINPDYFAGKLCVENEVFSSKNSVKSVRRHIKEELSYELPFYKFMSGQKELRNKLKELQATCDSDRDFVDCMSDLHLNLDLYDLGSSEEKEFRAILKDTICFEPWHFIESEPSPNYNWLKKLLPLIVREIRNLKSK